MPQDRRAQPLAGQQGQFNVQPGLADRMAKALLGPTALVLVLLFGLFSMIYGGSEIVVGVQMRRTGHTVEAVLHDAAA